MLEIILEFSAFHLLGVDLAWEDGCKSVQERGGSAVEGGPGSYDDKKL